MAVGFTGDDGVNDTILANLENELDRLRLERLQVGSAYCDVCDCKIPEGRRKAVPWTRWCVSCAEDMKATSYYNRRGSKDSQLR